MGVVLENADSIDTPFSVNLMYHFRPGTIFKLCCDCECKLQPWLWRHLPWLWRPAGALHHQEPWNQISIPWRCGDGSLPWSSMSWSAWHPWSPDWCHPCLWCSTRRALHKPSFEEYSTSPRIPPTQRARLRGKSCPPGAVERWHQCSGASGRSSSTS